MVSEISSGDAVILLDDGVRFILPLNKLPKGIAVGTFVSVSIRIDHIAALLNNPPAKQLVPKGQGL